MAYKKIWQRDGFNAKWRHFRNLTFLQSSSTNMDTDRDNERDFQYDESGFEHPFVTFNCSNDEIPAIKVCFTLDGRIGPSLVLSVLKNFERS